MSQLNYRVHKHKVHWSALDKPVITSYVLNNLRPFLVLKFKKKKIHPSPTLLYRNDQLIHSF